MKPPSHADQIGSFLRPVSLVQARLALKQDPSNPSLQKSLHEAQESAVADIVKKQLALSPLPITTGEFEREIFYGGFFERLSGFTFHNAPGIPVDSPQWRRHFPTLEKLRAQGVKARPAHICTGKIVYEQSPYLAEWLYLRGLVPTEMVRRCKMTLPSPTFMHFNFADGRAYSAESGYSSDREFLMDIAAAFRREVETLYVAGCRWMQVDDPNLSYFCDETFLEKSRADGYDLNALLGLYLEVHNECVRDMPVDLHLGLHICRGNAPNSTYYSSGGYERIAERVLKDMDYKLFYLEFDDPARSGGFRPLRHLPEQKAVVLGVVTTKSPEMEDKAELKRRVLEAVDVIAEGQGGGRTLEQVLEENLAVSPQCGFSSVSYGHGKGMTEEVMWKKLELVRDLARELWPQM